jgi:error-prone DNA polymerase
MTERYIELHAASAFSFLEAASLPESLVEQAALLEMPALALLDRNGFYGSARFHTMATKQKIRAHVGAEVSVDGMGKRLAPPEWTGHTRPTDAVRLPLLCASRKGYQNLCQMITRYKMREITKAEGAATPEDLEEFAEGLICLTGGDEGPLAAAMARGGEPEARRTMGRLVSIYGHENVYVELQRHQEREEEWRNQAALRIASSLRLPILATNGVLYATQYDREILDIFTGIRHGTELASAGRLRRPSSTRSNFRNGWHSAWRTWAMSFRVIRWAKTTPWNGFSISASWKASICAMAMLTSDIC